MMIILDPEIQFLIFFSSPLLIWTENTEKFFRPTFQKSVT